MYWASATPSAQGSAASRNVRGAVTGCTAGSPTRLGTPAPPAAASAAAEAEPHGTNARGRSRPIALWASVAARPGSPPSSSTSGATLRPPSRPPAALILPIASSTPRRYERQRSPSGPLRSATDRTVTGGAPGARGTPVETSTAEAPSTVAYQAPSEGSETVADSGAPGARRDSATERDGRPAHDGHVSCTRAEPSPRATSPPSATVFAPARAGASVICTGPSGSTALANAGPGRSVPRTDGSGWPRPCASPPSTAARATTA